MGRRRPAGARKRSAGQTRIAGQLAAGWRANRTVTFDWRDDPLRAPPIHGRFSRLGLAHSLLRQRVVDRRWFFDPLLRDRIAAVCPAQSPATNGPGSVARSAAKELERYPPRGRQPAQREFGVLSLCHAYP